MNIETNDTYLKEKINILKRKVMTSREESYLIDSYIYLRNQLKQNKNDKRLIANITLLKNIYLIYKAI